MARAPRWPRFSSGDAEKLLAAALGAAVSRSGDVAVERVTQVTLSTPADVAARSSAGAPIELTGAISAVEAELVNVEVERAVGCQPGYRCLGGELIPCPPGSKGDAKGERCLLCEAGTYQRKDAEMTCEACPEGSYCGVGTAAPTACPDGYWRRRKPDARRELHGVRTGVLVLGGQELLVQ